MDLKSSYEKASALDEVKQILKTKGFLCAISSVAVPGNDIAELRFSFYNPKSSEITDVMAGEEARVENVGKALRDSSKPLEWGDAKVDVNAALKTALTELKKKFGAPVQKVLISLTGDNAWSFICITKVFSTINVLVDAKSGKVLECAEDSII